MHPPIDYTDEFVDEYLREREHQFEPEPDPWHDAPPEPSSRLGPPRPRKLAKPAADQSPMKVA